MFVDLLIFQHFYFKSGAEIFLSFLHFKHLAWLAVWVTQNSLINDCLQSLQKNWSWNSSPSTNRFCFFLSTSSTISYVGRPQHLLLSKVFCTITYFTKCIFFKLSDRFELLVVFTISLIYNLFTDSTPEAAFRKDGENSSRCSLWPQTVWQPRKQPVCWCSQTGIWQLCSELWHYQLQHLISITTEKVAVI